LHFSNNFKKLYTNVSKFKGLFSQINNNKSHHIINGKFIKKKNNDKKPIVNSNTNLNISINTHYPDSNLTFFIKKLKLIAGIYKPNRLKKKKFIKKKSIKKKFLLDYTNKFLLDKPSYSEPKDIVQADQYKLKKKIYNLVIHIKRGNKTTAMYIINKKKNVLNEKKKNILKISTQKYPYYKITNKLFFKNILIKKIRKNLTINVFKHKLNTINQKITIKLLNKSLNFKELVILNNITKIPFAKNKKKKIIFNALQTNLTNKFKKKTKLHISSHYAQLHKLLTRLESKQIYNKIKKNLYAKNKNLIQSEKKLFNRFFIRSKIILNLKLSKKIKHINYLMQLIKKSKKITKKK